MTDNKATFIKQLLIGAATHIPGMRTLLAKGTGGTDSARYCYSVWLRHLVMAHKNGLTTRPETVAELGPGDSIGIGLAALISGVKSYSALDVVRYADNARNLGIFDDLVELFRNKEDIPDAGEFPNLKPDIDSYSFPMHILSDEYINEILDQKRVGKIRNSLMASAEGRSEGGQISYHAPWYDADLVKEGTIDMVFSQAVLEHIDDLEFTYRTLYRWLKPGGFMSHVIDFKSHGFAKAWNGNWAYSDLSWELIRGNRPYLLNREPLSTHVDLMKRSGFEIVCNMKTYDTTGIQRKHMADRFKNMSDDDLLTSCTFVQAVKK